MNPFRWPREHQVACVVVCVLGAIFGLFIGFFSIIAPARSGFTAGVFFKFWIQRPDLYWPWPAFGGVIAGLSFYVVRILRRVGDGTLGAKSTGDLFYPVIARAVSQLPNNSHEARQQLYDRARAALAAQLGGQEGAKSVSTREWLGLDAAISRVEKRASRAERIAKNYPVRPRTEHLQFRAGTGFLIISILFLWRGWLIDVTCMSLYWVARIPGAPSRAAPWRIRPSGALRL